jgi:Tat protein secretion system quality control protein TatD with DNase activity
MNKLKYIDCHSHPHDKKFAEAGVNPDEMMKGLKADGGATIAIGTNYTKIVRALEFANKYDNCWVTIGIHPADNHKEIYDQTKFQKYFDENKNKVVGVGECGLDYYYFDKIKSENPDFDIEKEKEKQKGIFTSQIEFAIKNNLPRQAPRFGGKCGEIERFRRGEKWWPA